MSNIVPFESAKLPAYLRAFDVASLNDDLTAHKSRGFPVISIKGKVFSIVRDGERNIVPNPKDPDSPATYMEVVILKANKNKSKVFYAGGYTEGSDDKPGCWSNDGIAPDISVEKPQARVCATCPKNQWGAKISESGKKLKACADSVKLAIAAPSALDDPYLMRIPAASMTGLGEYGDMLKKRGVGYQMVLTRISFDVAEATPKLLYKAVGFLDEAMYKEVTAVANGDVVQNIIGSIMVPDAASGAGETQAAAAAAISKAKTVTEEDVLAAITPEPIVMAAPKPAKPAVKAARPVEAEEPEEPVVVARKVIPDEEFDLSNLNFDD